MKITVIITAYNCEEYIKQCIESVMNQTHEDWQILVYNDASTDNTRNMYKSWNEEQENLLNSKGKVFVSEENGGALYGRHRLVNNDAEGEVVCFLGGDDYLEPNALEIIAKAYEDDNIQMTYGNWKSEQDIVNKISHYPKEVWEKNSFRRAKWRATALNTFRKSLLLRVDDGVLKDENGNFFKNCTDLAYSFPCLEMIDESQLKVIEEPIYIYRANHLNTTLNRLGKENKTKVREQLKRKPIYVQK